MPVAATHKAIATYYADLAQYHAQGVTHELALKTAFQTLLAKIAQERKWTLIPELTLDNGKRPDGAILDGNGYTRGYWEAKDPGDDLEAEIVRKIAARYPLRNTIFEDTRRAVLYQAGKRYDTFDLTQPARLATLLNTFFDYTEAEVAEFEKAVDAFKEQVPSLAAGLRARIQQEHAEHNPAFAQAWASFYQICKSSIDPNIRSEQVDDMLVQHLLTERLFRTVFDNDEFTSRNVIAAEIEKVIQALTSRAFNRREFLRSLDHFYRSIEDAAKGLEDWSAKQRFLNIVYERFFQGYNVKDADTHGIVYTPQEIVDFMCASVEEVLRREFNTSIAEPGVQILDPATGTGNFVVNLLRRIAHAAPQNLRRKYDEDLFANEIMLLPYYIAAMNIEHEYYVRTGEYHAFEGICFADTLNMEGQQMVLFTEHNTHRVQKEKEAKIQVVIGNPPYNAWQANENDNNKNRRYPVIDNRIRETYVKDSSATNRNALSDAYVRFFRWATDRLQGRDGIVAYVSNNSFVHKFAFDGMRKHLLDDFTTIYHLDLGGDMREHGGGNVFDITVGVGITVAVRKSAQADPALHYHRVPDRWQREEKLGFLAQNESVQSIQWQELQPDDRNTWLTEGLRSEFGYFLPVGSRKSKSTVAGQLEASTIFRTFSMGVKTNRDDWVYDFDVDNLRKRILGFIETYNGEIDRWKRAGEPDNVDDFVLYDDTRIKWSRDLKQDLRRKRYARFDPAKLRRSLYRPFTQRHYFFDPILSQDIVLQPHFFPTAASEGDNVVICVPGPGNRKDFASLATNLIVNLDLAFEKAQCFPLYTYNEDGSNRRDNITDWALARFREAYGGDVTKRDIFDYVYGLLHHPQYRERYAENLKRELPRIPFVPARAEYDIIRATGAALAKLHLDYETGPEYKLTWRFNHDVPMNWRVTKMKLTPDKRSLIYNEWLTLDGIPPEAFAYRLGNRSALEWVIDQYQVSTDHRSGITSDPNRDGSDDDRQYIARLVGKVTHVSVETVRLVNDLAARVDLLTAIGVAAVVGVAGAGSEDNDGAGGGDS